MTFIPKASARLATALPMKPNPIIPKVLPFRPFAWEYFPLFHIPFLRSDTLSGIFRSMEIARPITSSATASLFIPGQFETLMPIFFAIVLSMLLVPLPARIISFKPFWAFSWGSYTLVERTIRISGLIFVIALVKVWSCSKGSEKVVIVRCLFRCLTSEAGILSAKSILVEKENTVFISGLKAVLRLDILVAKRYMTKDDNLKCLKYDQ